MAKDCEKSIVERVPRRTLAVNKRKANFAPVDLGLREEDAVREAQRCLGLQSCESCDMCGLLCPDLAITRDEASGKIVIDLDYCKGCGICAYVCPKGAIRMVLEE